jgi:putative Mg2+ transporter-C (MgtC) family protein
MEWTSELEIVARVLVAGLLGAIIGLEREMMAKPAGLRTHLLVGAACALLVQLGEVMLYHFEAFHQNQILRADPIRIIEAIAAGISFIGAGTIIFDRSRGKLEGITTAASILMTAGIGIAVALRAYVTAVALTLLVAVVLHGLGRLERRMGWGAHRG